jgi:plasmid stabilization system protein ParE
MSAAVRLTDEAKQNARDIVDWYAEQSESAAARWYDGLLKLIDSLAIHPHRHPPAREKSHLPVELREAHYGSGRKITHRIIFAITPSAVVVYAIRHVAQQDWRPDDEAGE